MAVVLVGSVEPVEVVGAVEVVVAGIVDVDSVDVEMVVESVEVATVVGSVDDVVVTAG